MKRFASSSFIVATLFCAACGGATEPPAKAPDAAEAKPGLVYGIGQGQVTVVRLATPDGRIRLTLDRSGAKPKMQRDGTKDIVELTMEEDRFAGQLRGHRLVDPTGRGRMYLSVHGHYTLYDGRDELALRIDGEAKPLGAATLAGAPVYEKSKSELDQAAFTPRSVRAKLPAMKTEDASRLGKIEEALKSATADMFFRYVVHSEGGWEASLQVTPEGFGGWAYGGVAHAAEDKWQPATDKGLRKYGGFVRGFTDYESRGHMQVLEMSGYGKRLASGTPGLVWEVDGGTAVFVTLDGGRYLVSLGQEQIRLEPGAGSEADWPQPLQHALLDVSSTTALVKVGEVAKTVAETLTQDDEEWWQCTRKVWASVQRKIDNYKFTEADRKDTVARAERECAGAVKKEEAAFLAVTAARADARAALYEKAKARVRELAKR